MSKRKATPQRHFAYFDNPDTFVERMYALTPDKVLSGQHREMITSWRSRCDDDEFYGNINSTYKDYIENNFTSFAKRIDMSLDKIDINTAAFLESKWEYVMRQEEGDEVDVSRYLADEDRYWNCCRKKKKNRDVVRVYFSGGANCFTSNQELAINGAVAVAVAEALEAQGINTELWLGYACERACTNGDGLTTLIKLKDSNEYCDFGKLGFLCGQGKFFRSFGFSSFLETAERDGKTLFSHLGRSVPLTKENLCLEGEEACTSIVVPQLYTSDTAKEWLEDFFNKK